MKRSFSNSLPNSLYEMFIKTQQTYPNKTFLHVNKNYSISYGDFYRKIIKQRNFLIQQNISKGDTVVIIGKNTQRYIYSLLAINGIGAIAFPINEEEQIDVTSYLIGRICPKLIFNSTNKSVNTSQTNIKEINHEKINFDSYLNAVNIDTEPDLSEQNISTYFATSGTSGMPKIVPLTNHNIISNIYATQKCANNGLQTMIGPNDLIFSMLPLNHTYGSATLYTAMSNGASFYKNNDLNNLRTDMLHLNPTILCTVPKFFEQLNKKTSYVNSIISNMPNKIQTQTNKFMLNKIFGNKIRFSTVGGAAMSANLFDYFDNLGLKIYQGYGSTECSPMISLCNDLTENSNSLKNRKFSNKLSVGKILECNNVFIDTSEIDKDLIDLYKNEIGDKYQIGEILVNGSNVMHKYHGHTNEISHKFINSLHYYRTGDIGFMDENGNLYILGRIKEQFKLSNGKFVDYVKIENLLLTIPQIQQVVVFGKDQEYLSAIIVTESNESVIKNKIKEIQHNFKKFEIPQKIILTNKPFTTENGLLTQKKSPRREQIIKKYVNNN